MLVVKQYHDIGGMTLTEELTLPGFKSDLHASGYQLANLSPVPRELGLVKHGLEIIKPDIKMGDWGSARERRGNHGQPTSGFGR